jgi:Contact-dependent growth inhibition CdiA C-terminal domain
MSLTNRQRYAQFNSKEWHKIEFNDATDSYIVIHKKHGFHERESNLRIARRLIKLGYSVELMPIIENEKSFDAYMNGESWEFKTTNGSKGSIQGRLRDGKEQCDKILLVLPIDIVLREIIDGMNSAINMDKSKKITSIGLLFETALVILSREEILENQFDKLEFFFDNMP